MYTDLSKKFDYEMSNSYAAKSAKYLVGAFVTGALAIGSHPIVYLPIFPMLYASGKFYKQSNIYLKNFEKELKK